MTAKVESTFLAKDGVDVLGISLPQASAAYKIKCTALVELIDVPEEASDLEPYLLEDGRLAKLYREEWTVLRSMKDFQALHKHLKAQVAYAESSASTGSRLVGAATAAFGNNVQGRKQRKALIPSLAQASSTGAIAVTKKAIIKRGELLDSYLDYILSANHLLKRSTEILLFLGAFYPLPSEVKVAHTPDNLLDPMGRTNHIRSVAVDFEVYRAEKVALPNQNKTKKDSGGTSSMLAAESKQKELSSPEESAMEVENNADINISILNKVDQVPLAEVRNRLVELFRYQFGFENASFLRSRMLSALETASFVAVTKASNFRKMLYDLHIQYLNQDSLADWIGVLLDLLWPDGVWMASAPPLSEEEER